jgi:acyl-CoA thioester hydrolase
MKGVHTYPVRVFYEDTDAAGIVYYANYLKFAERARTEALRLSGINQSDLFDDAGIGFVVRRCTADFLKPARLDDLLTIETRLEDINKVSIEMRQAIRCDNEILVKLLVKLVVVGKNGKLVKLPDFVKKAMLTVLKIDK